MASSQEDSMATGIPLSHCRPDVSSGRGYKLLELPPELVELLEGSNPPTLTLTSSPTAALLKVGASSSITGTTGGEEEEEEEEKVYSLRQKNTSNALILLSPTATTATATAAPSNQGQPPPPPPSGFGAGAGAGAGAGLSAIATLHDTIELVPEKTTGAATAPAAKAKGKWHERFGRSR
ncbi:hypothetical protein QBC46DRAFT_169010 [Diplogelasinospora grovesii]|uniref:Sister chromatid cohesion protein DCC1 n=1 Tax=Diplogelasinospora grovesii TaxID=303347 RepID=A0AAN6N6G1_9PEZI|nr:hypothetical protein QBC46DRAFT_169010 [Diplogelasinospora grovesii]